MSSAGHVMDMINRSKYNASIRKKRTERISKIKDAYREEISKHQHVDFYRKDIDKQELERVKERIRTRMTARRRKIWVFTGLATILAVVVLYQFVILPFILVNS